MSWCDMNGNQTRLQASLMCLWTIFNITFSNSLPIVDKRLIGRRLWENLESLPDFGKVITFASFQDIGKCESQMQWSVKCARCTSGLLGRCLRHSFGMPLIPQVFFSFRKVIFCSFKHCLSTCHSWLSSHRLWGVNWFSKQSAIMLALSNRWYLTPEGPWPAVGAFCAFFMRDFEAGYIAWGVTSQFLNFISHRSSACLPVIFLMVFLT